MMCEEREQEQKQSYLQGTYLIEEQQFKEIQSNKRSFLGVSIKNSPLYDDVMEKLRILTNNLSKTVYNEADDYGEKEDKLITCILNIQQCYLNLLKSCSNYLNANKGIKWTSSGRARRKLVKEIYNQAQHEIDYLDFVNGCKILKLCAFSSKITFKEILEDMRTEVIDVTGRKDIENFGGATSSGIAIGEGENKRFFKPEEFALEKVKSYYNICSQLINKLAVNNKEKNVFRKILFCKSELFTLISTAFFDAMSEEYIYTSEKLKVYLNLCHITFSTNKKGDIIIDGFKLTEASLTNFFKVVDEFMRLINFSELTNTIAKIYPGSRVDIRNVATSRLFGVLGDQDLVAKSRLATLREGRVSDKKGIIMDKAKGKSLRDLSDNLKLIDKQNVNIRLSKDVQRKFANLQLGDYIAGQVDRNMGNFFVDYILSNVGGGTEETAEVYITSIQGIDNDMSFGLLQGQKIINSPVQVLPAFLNFYKKLSLPYIDKDFADRLVGLNEPTVTYVFADLLNFKEMDAFINRIQAINKVIEDNYDENHKLNSQEWGQASLDETLKVDNYLSNFINFVRENLTGKNFKIVSD